jgi:F-type H+-transporting ATPase subunit b
MLHEIVSGHEFWVAIAFIIAVGALVYKAAPAITTALDARAAKIKTELDEAQRLREDAQRTLGDYQRKQRDALKEAEQIVAQARAEAERAAEQAARDLAAGLERRQRLAMEKIALAESRATAEVRNAAVDVAIAAVRRILTETLDAERKRKLINDAIAELPQRLH